MPAKAVEINLESGMPAADAAVMNMKNSLMACRRRGVKAVVLIHGYGSTGTGGAIRQAVRKSLDDGELRGVALAHAGGEQWHWRKREFLAHCRDLAGYEARIANNGGVTVVLLK